MQLRQKAFKAVKWTASSSVISAILSVIKIAILSRILDKSDFGIVAVVYVILGFASVFKDLGLSAGILHKKHITSREYSSLYCFNLILGVVIFLLLIILASPLAIFYESPPLKEAIPWMSLTVLFSAFGNQHKIIAQKSLNFKYIELVEILAMTLGFVLAILLAYHGFGVYALIYSYVLEFFIANLIYAIRGLNNQPFRLRLVFHEIRPFLKIGGYQTAGQMLNYFSSQIDQLIVGKQLSLATLGGYNLVKTLAAKPLGLLNPIVNKISAPLLSIISDDQEKLDKTYLRMLKSLGCFTIPLYLSMAALAKPLILIIFGPQYEQYHIAFFWLCLYMMLRSLGNPIGGLIIAKGRTELDLYWNSISFIILPVSVYLLSSIGLNALTQGLFTIMCIFYFMVYYVVIKRLTKISLSEYLSIFYEPLKISIPVVVTILMVSYLIDDLYIKIGVAFVLSVLVFYFTIHKISKNDSDLRMILNTMKL